MGYAVFRYRPSHGAETVRLAFSICLIEEKQGIDDKVHECEVLMILAAYCRADATLSLPNVEHLPMPHPDWSPESGEKQSMPYEGQPFKALDPAVSPT